MCVTECLLGWQRRLAAQRGKSLRTLCLSPGWTAPGSRSSTRAMCLTTSLRGPIPSMTEPATMKSSKCRSLELQMFSWLTCRLFLFLTFEELTSKQGPEYCLLHVQEPILYVVRKQIRHSPTQVMPPLLDNSTLLTEKTSQAIVKYLKHDHWAYRWLQSVTTTF